LPLQIGECPEGLLDVGARVRTMHLIQVDPVGLQPTQTVLDLTDDPAPRVSALVRVTAFTNDSTLARRAKHLTTTARTPHRWSFLHDEVGYNYRLPNLNAALGCAQLERLPSMVARKRRLAARYEAAFGALRGLRFLSEPPGTVSNYWLNSIVLDAPGEALRDDVLATLNDAGYMARPVWTLMHELPMYAGCPRMDLEVAESMAARIVSLPSSAKLGE